MMAESKTFTARCHCSNAKLSFAVPASSLPLTSHTCHCSICRRIHGTLSVFHARIPSPPTPDPRHCPSLTSYRAHPSSDVLRFFCSTCGSQLIALAEADQHWFVSTGLVEGGDETVFEYKEAIFATHAVDGGLADWLDQRVTRKWDTFIGVGESLEADAWENSKRRVCDGERGSVLHVYCQCRGVEFRISRPDYASTAFQQLFPHLEIPSVNLASRTAEKDEGERTWWVARDPSKYLASACLCTSCRLSTGCELTCWASVAIMFITPADGSPFKTEFGTLKTYNSSPDTFRRQVALLSLGADKRFY
ncbi:hypothetical protein, variant [Verruconis gallopava]|uniref:CENP-V/GFA domain-containing protein n=1 Tax=Verruconis gallopava TaxID=253628 RepID=A0A0D2A3B5_9PEZI|nr:hypothetical protein, variant [Verruconis gallopava]KIW00890.1 hypothetical protein, variant [Verruconis gallopava]